eukprot:gnl/TRDRNA2_/TRDRNA2_187971_c0_seq1.p1 gnl/TRDRNA2_/TRDRNA2_187971_c0~~gnl/TRDRNA2_/TRDRNA2_187971_c0_seq1.p1  ORF type:complete len:167 (+),score=27.05 gnl/TRDRNA2_/TRDRNA2_187971_c0_seq1:81-581(+)
MSHALCDYVSESQKHCFQKETFKKQIGCRDQWHQNAGRLKELGHWRPCPPWALDDQDGAAQHSSPRKRREEDAVDARALATQLLLRDNIGSAQDAKIAKQRGLTSTSGSLGFVYPSMLRATESFKAGSAVSKTVRSSISWRPTESYPLSNSCHEAQFRRDGAWHIC